MDQACSMMIRATGSAYPPRPAKYWVFWRSPLWTAISSLRTPDAHDPGERDADALLLSQKSDDCDLERQVLQ